MKTTITTFFLIIAALSLTAQDATNDATWEETKGFINKYINQIDSFSYEIIEDYCCELELNKDDFKINIVNDFLEIDIRNSFVYESDAIDMYKNGKISTYKKKYFQTLELLEFH